MADVVGGKSKPLDIEKAISIADICLKKLTELVGSKIGDVRLEEFGLNGNNWKITLSYVTEKGGNVSALNTLYGSNLERLYKVFIVDSSTEEVVGMEDKK